jgi:hypothetical protein
MYYVVILALITPKFLERALCDSVLLLESDLESTARAMTALRNPNFFIVILRFFFRCCRVGLYCGLS